MGSAASFKGTNFECYRQVVSRRSSECRLRVINGPTAFEIRLPFYPQERIFRNIIYVNGSFAPQAAVHNKCSKDS
jgi:hypothetical protein